MTRIVFSLILSFVFTSCYRWQEPPIVNEGQLLLRFKVGIDTFQFSRIEAEGANRNVPLAKPYRLPMNSSADSTRYFFHSDSRTDTLTISYTRKFTFDPKGRAGYELYLDFVQIRKNTLSKNGFIERSDVSSDSLVGQILLED